MIDFSVARDKLCQFQTVEDLADFLRSEAVVGRKELADSCVIARWMQVQTGQQVSVSVDEMWIGPGSVHNSSRHNAVLEEFIYKFDTGEYPELEDDGGSYDGDVPGWRYCS